MEVPAWVRVSGLVYSCTVCVYEGLNNTYSLSTHKPPSAKCNGSGNKQQTSNPENSKC